MDKNVFLAFPPFKSDLNYSFFSKAFPDSASVSIRTLLLYCYWFTWTLYKTWGLQTSNEIQLTDWWKKSRLDRRDQLEHNMKSSNSRETPAVINLGEWDEQFPWRWLPLELPKPKRLLWVDWLLGLAKVHQHDDGWVHSLSPRLMLLRQPEW